VSNLSQTRALVSLRKKLAEAAQVRAMRKKNEAVEADLAADKAKRKANDFVNVRREKRKQVLESLSGKPSSLMDVDNAVGKVSGLSEKEGDLFRQVRNRREQSIEAWQLSDSAHEESLDYQKRENASQHLWREVQKETALEEEAFEAKEIEDTQRSSPLLPPIEPERSV